jgi:hypothetical protein
METARQNYHLQRLRGGRWVTVESYETRQKALSKYAATKGRRRVVHVIREVIAMDEVGIPRRRVMRSEDMRPASDPPDTCRRVVLRFGDDGRRDCIGFYWSDHGAFYKSDGGKSRLHSVHPTHWAEFHAKETV